MSSTSKQSPHFTAEPIPRSRKQARAKKRMCLSHKSRTVRIRCQKVYCQGSAKGEGRRTLSSRCYAQTMARIANSSGAMCREEILVKIPFSSSSSIHKPFPPRPAMRKKAFTKLPFFLETLMCIELAGEPETRDNYADFE